MKGIAIIREIKITNNVKDTSIQAHRYGILPPIKIILDGKNFVATCLI